VLRVLRFHLKVALRDYFVIFAIAISLVVVIVMVMLLGENPTTHNGLLQGKIGVYLGIPIPISFGNIVVYTSTQKMVDDIKHLNVPVGVDVKHRVLYTAPIYADISTKALAYMASAAENIIKGKGLYPYIDEVWWDPYAADGRYVAYAFMLLYLFLADFLLMYLSLAYRAKSQSTEKIWHLLGLSPLAFQASLILLTLLSSFLVVVPILVVKPEMWKVLVWTFYLTWVSAGISAYFMRYATNIMTVYLALLIPIGLLFGAMTYVLLPDKLGIFAYTPWTYAFVDIFCWAGADGSIGGLTSAMKWGNVVVWGIVSLYMWYKGVIANV